MSQRIRPPQKLRGRARSQDIANRFSRRLKPEEWELLQSITILQRYPNGSSQRMEISRNMNLAEIETLKQMVHQYIEKIDLAARARFLRSTS
jgi:hypothetical protein